MKKRLAELACRRRGLLDKIEFQRMEMAEISCDLQKPLVLVDAGLNAVHYIYNHRALVAGSVAALLTFRRKGIVGLAQKGWRLLVIYPSIFTFGLKYLSLASRSRSENCNTVPDH